jgi:hypothetical protein
MQTEAKARNFFKLIEELNLAINYSSSLKSACYYCIINAELFIEAKQKSTEYFNQLISADFARANSSHMNEGVFGAYVWTQHMAYSKMQFTAALLNCITSGNRLIKFMLLVRRLEGKDKSDWGKLRVSLKKLESDFIRFRNILEHIDEMIGAKSPDAIDKDFGFSPQGMFNYKVKGLQFYFDFSEEESSQLIQLERLYNEFIEMLRKRSNPSAQ